MTDLALSFRCLANAYGVSPWNQDEFARWLATESSDATIQAGLFVLSVWNGRNDLEFERDRGDIFLSRKPWWVEQYGLGVFDAVFATVVWEAVDRAAFREWLTEPFFP